MSVSIIPTTHIATPPRFQLLVGAKILLSRARVNIAAYLDYLPKDVAVGEEMSIAVVDSSTRLVHVVLLKRGGDATISEFIRTVEEQLTQAALEGQCVRVLCAAVGDSCINICDKLRTVLYYLLDGKPWYIRTGVFSF